MKKIALFLCLVATSLPLVACSGFGNRSHGSNKPSTDPPTDDPVDPPSGIVTPPPSGGNTDVGTGNEGDTGDGKGAVITFSAGDGAFLNGNKSISINADSSGAVEMNSTPVLDAHAFDGWYNGTVKYDPESTYSAACTFTARYRSGSDYEVYNALFDENSTVEIKIDMSDAEWKKLNNDYIVFSNRGSKSPIYRMADAVTIYINGYNYYYKEVGVRMKGNTSRHEFYGDNGFNDYVHLKLSFKQTFDDPADGYTQSELKVWSDANALAERKNRMFADMEKIDIKYNATKDETYVREMYAMKLFRDNGVASPHITLAGVTALQCDTSYKNLGVYKVYECIDEKFIRHNFGDTAVGDLWKCTYTSTGPADLTDYDLDNRVGVEDEMEGRFYSYDKKTNKKKDKVTGERDLSSIKNFIRAVNRSNADYSAVLDMEYFAMFEAVNYMLGNPDCIRNNYNNYYIYFRSTDGKAIMIPYDYDRCLGITADWNPTGSANMYVTPYTRTVAANGSGQNNPLYKNLIDKGAPTGVNSLLQTYRALLIMLTSSPTLTSNAFNAYENIFKSRYSAYVDDNNHRFDNNYAGNVSFDEYITTKIQTTLNNIDNYYA